MAVSYDPRALLTWSLDQAEGLLNHNGRMTPEERKFLTSALDEFRPLAAAIFERHVAEQPLLLSFEEVNALMAFCHWFSAARWRWIGHGYAQTDLMRAALAARKAKAEAALQTALKAVYQPDQHQSGKVIERAVNQKLTAAGFPAVNQSVIWARLRALKRK